MLGAGAAIAAMASLLWGGDAGAAESERLNSHVTASEPGRASGRGPEPHFEREICRGGREERAPLACGVGCHMVEGRCGKDVGRAGGRRPRERHKTFGLKGQNEDSLDVPGEKAADSPS